MASINNLTAVYADKFYLASSTGVSEISETYATKTQLSDINNTAEITANTDAIAIVNTKQLQNFNAINDINTDLTNNYQTNTALATNFYNKTEVDMTFTNYYTSSQIDTNLSTNYQTNAQLSTNYYNKSEIDANNWIDATALSPYVLTTTLTNDYYTTTQTQANYYDKTYIDANIGGGGYSDTDIDNLLALRVPVSDFTNRFSTNPIIDCSAPTVIHSGLTLNNSTINISPVAGLVFSNQTGGGDKVLAEFKNATSYITLQGDKIFCNNTSDDAIKQLDLTNNNAGYKMSGKIEAPTGLTIENTRDGNLSFTVRNTDNYITFNNDSIDSFNASDDTGRIVNLNANADQYVKSHSLLIDTGVETLTSGYTLDVVDSAIVRQNLRVDNNIDLTNSTGEIQLPTAGIDMFRNTGDANYNLRIRDTQGVFEFRNRQFRCMNPSNPANGTEMILHDTGGDYRLRIGSQTTATVGIGRQYNFSYHLTVGGVSNFNETRVENDATFLGQQLISTDARVFQRADMNNSLNVVSTEEINFSLQTDRTTDPTTGTIALQLNETNGITINRAVANNQTFNSIGNIVGEADVVSWGRFMFQNSSELKEVLDGQYKLFVRNGDTLGDINLTVGLESSTPEFKITDGKVKMNNLEITQETISTVDQIQFLNTDAGGEYYFYFGSVGAGNEVLEIAPGGVFIDGTFGYSSDVSLKDNVKEINSKKCYEITKYVKPKTFNFTRLNEDKNKVNHIGYIAQDYEQVVPKEWEGIITTDNKGHKRLDYCKTAVITHGALQHLMKEHEELTDLVKTMKKEMATMKGELTKLKKKIKDDSD